MNDANFAPKGQYNTVIYPENFEIKTGFARIREMLEAKCRTNLGREHVKKIRFSRSYSHIQQAIDQVEEFRTIHLMEAGFDMGSFGDVRPSLKKIRVEGTYAETKEIFALKRSLETARSLMIFFKGERKTKYPNLSALAEEVIFHPFVLEQASGLLTKEGEIRDSASSELASIRQSIKEKEASVSRGIRRVLKKAQAGGFVEEGASFTFREGRMVIPVPANEKRKVPGYIHDESATGKTVFIEPAEIVELNNEIKELEYAERREIIKILSLFADGARPYLDDLLLLFEWLGKMEFIYAKTLLAVQIRGIRPVIVKHPKVSWKGAVHPLLQLSLEKENKKIVPLDISLDNEQRVLVISGPNAGGKSVCLQTLGLLQYMLQCGLLIPLSENSEVGIFDKLFMSIGDEQSIENDLSTYSSHLLHLKYFTRNANEKSLFLIDEFGAGTEPLIGGAIAESVLEELNQKEAFGVVTTHYTNLKHYATSTPGIINGAMLFDTHHMEPRFELQIGEAGSSFAFEIARKIGLAEHILQKATRKVGKEHVDFDKNLKDIIRDKNYLSNKRKEVRQKEKKLDEMLEKYSGELQSLYDQQKEIKKQAKAEAEKLLDTVNKKIENTIYEIRKAQAEKEKTKKIRENFDQFREQVLQEESAEEEKLRQKMNHIHRKKEQKAKKTPRHTRKEKEKPGSRPEEAIVPGDTVKIKGQGTFAEVLEIEKDKLLLAMGNMKMTMDKNKVEKAGKNQQKKHSKNTSRAVQGQANYSRKNLSFKPNLDIRGKRADEALQQVTSFIDEAVISDTRELKILHGKGNGVLRQVIRDYLNTEPVVNSYHDEKEEHGGAGITIVHLS